eukprot:1196435-Prorocentrum_minimum.AAC.7
MHFYLQASPQSKYEDRHASTSGRKQPTKEHEPVCTTNELILKRANAFLADLVSHYTYLEVDFVGYVPNPEFRRGATPGEASRKVATLRYARVKGRMSTEAEFAREKQKAESMLPKGYHRVIVKQPANRRVFEEFEFSLYNKTNFAGLENGMRNCYVNSLLQASNLLRSLKQIREAAALGLLEDPALDNLKTTARQTKPPLSRQIQVRTNDIPCLQKQEREASPNIHVALHGVQIKT